MDAGGATTTHEVVKDYYGKVLKSSEDLKTSACCTADAAPGFLRPLFAAVPGEIMSRYYGCGFPVPAGLSGCSVLDLGCGTGRDVYLAAQLVGSEGRVVGVDMTDEQLEVARRYRDSFAEAQGMRPEQVDFVKGYIEDLATAGLGDASFDVAISNCVVNLSADKRAVLSEIHRVLKEGGEFYFSDVFVDRRLPADVACHDVLYGECLGGALYKDDFVFMARDVGFRDARAVTAREIEIHDPEIRKLIGSARFYSVTYRLFKIGSLDYQCEDYGQSVTYQGGVEGSENLFWFDDHHCFEKGRSERVCGNTFDMLKARFGGFFSFTGDRSVHFGKYPDCDTMATMTYRPTASDGGAASCC